MAQVFLLDIENRKGITIYNENNNNPSDLTIFPNVKRRPNGSLLIYVIPSNTGRRLEWLYAKDNSGKIIDYRQFKINSTENINTPHPGRTVRTVLPGLDQLVILVNRSPGAFPTVFCSQGPRNTRPLHP